LSKKHSCTGSRLWSAAQSDFPSSIQVVSWRLACDAELRGSKWICSTFQTGCQCYRRNPARGGAVIECYSSLKLYDARRQIPSLPPSPRLAVCATSIGSHRKWRLSHPNEGCPNLSLHPCNARIPMGNWTGVWWLNRIVCYRDDDKDHTNLW
jgi:hypothetical protein